MRTSSSVTMMVWRQWRRAMLTHNAHPRNAISRPENGSTGQNPLNVMNPAIANETAHMPPKNRKAVRTLSEQCGQISMRCSSGCTVAGSLSGLTHDGTEGHFLFKSKTYERKMARELFAAANVGVSRLRYAGEDRQRRFSHDSLEGR